MALHHELGKEGENAAAAHLVSKGYAILCRNYRFEKAEVDIIALKDGLLRFVEVKTRRNNLYGDPEEFVSERKQYLFTEAAEAWLEETKCDYEVQFDIIAITGTKPPFRIEHIEDAF